MTEPVWTPPAQRVARSNLTRFKRMLEGKLGRTFADYHALYAWSIEEPAQFWQSVWEFCQVIASKPCTSVFTAGETLQDARWFQGACLNFAENLLHYRDDHIAIVSVAEDGQRQQWTYAELYRDVAKFAAFLRARGVGVSDRVVGLLPNLGQTVIAMCAATSLGAVWSSCSPDFGEHAVRDRFGQIAPKVLISVDGYTFKGKPINVLNTVAQLQDNITSITTTVVIPYLSDTPHLDQLKHMTLWDEALQNEADELTFAQLPFNHPLYIMYSSGTTGKPKCIVHGAGGTLIQHLKELVLHTDLKRADRISFYTTCGWMMWNWLVSSLAVGATVVLYEGAPLYPRIDRLFELVNDEGITVLGVSAKYLSALEKANFTTAGSAHGSEQVRTLRTILSTGSPLLPEQFDYVYSQIKADVCLSSISGGTDIISCFMLGCPTLPVYRGQLQCRGLGLDVAFYNEAGEAVVQEKGELVCRNAFPSMPVYFFNDRDGKKYKAAYFSAHPNVWTHGDYGQLTAEGGGIIYGRSDTVLNPGGVRIGTAEIYRPVEKIDAVLESLVVEQAWQDDSRIILFVVLREGATCDDKLISTIQSAIRKHASPRHVPSKIIAVADLPRTLNGKICELAVRRTINHQPVSNKDALANPEALDAIANLDELSS